LSERRFTDKPDLNPAAVMSLPEDHPAMRGNRTLFPITVETAWARGYFMPAESIPAWEIATGKVAV
jgi:hypothetical protein